MAMIQPRPQDINASILSHLEALQDLAEFQSGELGLELLAESSLQRAIVVASDQLGHDSPAAFRARLALGSHFVGRGARHYRKAEEIFRSVAQESGRALGQFHEVTMKAVHELHNVCRIQGQWQGKESEETDFLRRALADDPDLEGLELDQLRSRLWGRQQGGAKPHWESEAKQLRDIRENAAKYGYGHDLHISSIVSLCHSYFLRNMDISRARGSRIDILRDLSKFISLCRQLPVVRAAPLFSQVAIFCLWLEDDDNYRTAFSWYRLFEKSSNGLVSVLIRYPCSRCDGIIALPHYICKECTQYGVYFCVACYDDLQQDPANSSQLCVMVGHPLLRIDELPLPDFPTIEDRNGAADVWLEDLFHVLEKELQALGSDGPLFPEDPNFEPGETSPSAAVPGHEYFESFLRNEAKIKLLRSPIVYQDIPSRIRSTFHDEGM
jgi:hypothetical protein